MGGADLKFTLKQIKEFLLSIAEAATGLEPVYRVLQTRA